MPGENLDLSSEPPDDQGDDSATPRTSAGRRPFLGVHFVCCDVYARIYVNRRRTAYEGHCPKCSRKATVEIAPGGSDARFFQAG